MRKNLLFFIAILLIYFVVALVPDNVAPYIGNVWGRSALLMAGWVVWLITLMGLIGVALKLHDGKRVRVADIFAYYPFFFSFFVAQILYFLIVLGGLLLFIVPGIIFAMRFWFFDYFIIDRRLGPIEALRQSWRMTRGKAGRVLLFVLAVMGVSVLGALAFFVGLFIALPVTMMATVFVYRKLLSQTEETKEEKEDLLEEEEFTETEEKEEGVA